VAEKLCDAIMHILSLNATKIIWYNSTTVLHKSIDIQIKHMASKDSALANL